MSKFLCKCGYVISDVKYPSPANSVMLSEASLDRFLSFAEKFIDDLKLADSEGQRLAFLRGQFNEGYPLDASDAEVVSDALLQKLNEFTLSVVKCESCGRIHIQTHPESTDYVAFTPDVSTS
jgi:hypothetical protein